MRSPMDSRIEALAQLLGGYFHEDWTAEHGTAGDCLDRIMAEAPVVVRRAAAAEISALLDRDLCESQIRDLLLYEIGCCYAPESDGFEASTWLVDVRRRLLGAVVE